MSTQPGYKFENVVLVESLFKRDDTIQVEVLPGNFRVRTGYQVSDEKKIHCVIDLEYNCMIEEKKVLEAQIKMIGTFERIGEPDLSVEAFATINGPAIIFPFIREHLASLSVKAGLAAILLPPVNFVNRAKEGLKD